MGLWGAVAVIAIGCFLTHYLTIKEIDYEKSITNRLQIKRRNRRYFGRTDCRNGLL